MLRRSLSSLLGRGLRGVGTQAEVNGVPVEVHNPSGSIRCVRQVNCERGCVTEDAAYQAFRLTTLAGLPSPRTCRGTAG